MGFTFDIQMANIVAYLTTSSRTPPRVSYPELSSFLGILSGVEPGPEGVFSETLISSSPDWVIAVKQTARLAWNDLTNQPDWSKQVPESEITARLATIRGLLSDHHLFGLAVGSWQDDQQLRAFINYAAFDSGHNALFLVPTGWNADSAIKLLDPFPAVALAAERSQDWPGVVFWSRKCHRRIFAPTTGQGPLSRVTRGSFVATALG